VHDAYPTRSLFTVYLMSGRNTHKTKKLHTRTWLSRDRGGESTRSSSHNSREGRHTDMGKV